MSTRLLPVCLLVAACGGAAKPTPTPVPAPATSPACASPEHRQLDFWVGDWDLVVTAGATTEHATQHVTSILGGCAIAEDFASDGGGGTPWAGRSHSVWQPSLGKWRQTWVDDQGSYLAFVGGLEDGVMTLYGEPMQKDGQTVEMRMVFLDVQADSLRWEWQKKSVDGTWVAQMVIEYRRRR